MAKQWQLGEIVQPADANRWEAVVADAVRGLAQRSAQSASETTSLIGMTVDRIRNGASIAEHLSSTFKEIEGGSETVARLIGEISTATNEQALGVDQINTAVAQLDKVTQQSAASAEATARAAEQLNSQSVALDDMVGQMSKLITGK